MLVVHLMTGSITKIGDMEISRAFDGKSLFAPWLIPFDITTQTVFRVIDAIFQGINHG